jgi:xylose isomerase
MSKLKTAVILGVYGKPADRFMTGGYRNVAVGTLELIELAGKQGIVQGVEMIEGEEAQLNEGNREEVRRRLEEYGLTLCAVNPNLWGELQWARGTLGAADAFTRSKAIDRVKSAMDLAAEMGCDYVGLWPGQDGYDYPFEVDYQRIYDWWVEGVRACADHNPGVRLGLEYKPYEPRTHSFISTDAKTLLLLDDIDRANVGVTVDVGHSLYAHENLGEVVAVSQRKNRLFHIHLNDNYSDWDWDMNFGSVHLYEFLEMLYWLKRTHYQGWYSIDIFPYRTDGSDSVAESIHWLEWMNDWVEGAGLETLDELIVRGDPIATSRFLRGQFLATRGH